MEQGGAGRWSDAELHGALARVFGYTAFRPHQIEIVRGFSADMIRSPSCPRAEGKACAFSCHHI